MQKKHCLPIALIAAAILSGCVTPVENQSLAEAHRSYSSALSNPQVTNLAALELKEASDSLGKADSALREGQSAENVNHLAYIANQRVKIAQETADRKAAEQAVADASASRNQVRLEARTAEASAAKQETAAIKQTAEQQAAIIAQQESQLRELNAKKTERGMVITLGDVLFDTNKSQLKRGGMRNIQKLADFMNQYPQRKVMVEGHTDSTGSSSLNQRLSEQRADAVRSALVGMGISADRVTTRGYAAEFPVASNATASGRRSNRRVEIIISDDEGNIAPR